jgi:predicted GIY-YIG superfamily endonuclease
MELEGVYERSLVIGPKKYVCFKPPKPPWARGDYEFTANGVRAGCVTQVDIAAEFETVLGDGVERGQIQLDHFSILGTSGFELHHSVEAKKTVRFLCLKGKLTEDGKGLTWWQDEEEFQEYAQGLQPIGWDEKTGVPAEKSKPAPKRKVEWKLAEIAEWKPRDRKKAKVQLVDDGAGCDDDEVDDAATDEEMGDFIALEEEEEEEEDREFSHAALDNSSDFVVYILENDQGASYPGMTNNMDRRLRQHNGEISGGATVPVAQAVAGHPWVYFGYFEGFRTKRDCLRFEAALRHLERQSASHAFELALGLARKGQYRGVLGRRASS